jgi:hypothetical protein
MVLDFGRLGESPGVGPRVGVTAKFLSHLTATFLSHLTNKGARTHGGTRINPGSLPSDPLPQWHRETGAQASITSQKLYLSPSLSGPLRLSQARPALQYVQC